MDSWSPLAVALAAALGLMNLVWVASLVKRDASIVDYVERTNASFPWLPAPGGGS